jgi:5-(carboxyamino)imidazole ribonucleotide synthase
MKNKRSLSNRIGIVGGGQLGRMLTFEAKKLGFHVTILDPTPKSPAGQVADEQIIASFKDEKAIKELAKKSDYLTFEFELADAGILEDLSKEVLINPSPKTLNLIKDKLNQKKFLKRFIIPTADFIELKKNEDIARAVKRFGYPMMLKTRLDGYDGKGNFLIKNELDINKGIDKLKMGGRYNFYPEGRKIDSFYIEKLVPFKKELAVIVARSIKGEIVSYPVVETVHKNNICHLVYAPAPIDKKTSERARRLAEKVMRKLKGAGVFGIEMFLTKKGEVLINEIAPRVHNSGHFTIEGCVTSQFEQHIRAISGLPLGSTEMVSNAAVMINILGEREGESEVKGMHRALTLPNVSVHIYGKAETKKERKMGHITAIDTSLQRAYKKVSLARKMISI